MRKRLGAWLMQHWLLTAANDGGTLRERVKWRLYFLGRRLVR